MFSISTVLQFFIYYLKNLFIPSFQEKYKRALADTENLRKRSQKMIEDAKLYGNDQFSIFQQDPPHNMGFTMNESCRILMQQ